MTGPRGQDTVGLRFRESRLAIGYAALQDLQHLLCDLLLRYVVLRSARFLLVLLKMVRGPFRHVQAEPVLAPRGSGKTY